MKVNEISIERLTDNAKVARVLGAIPAKKASIHRYSGIGGAADEEV
jgi:hypothetical protein